MTHGKGRSYYVIHYVTQIQNGYTKTQIKYNPILTTEKLEWDYMVTECNQKIQLEKHRGRQY